ncbi:Uncharacterized conserved protein YbjT, contains NAD(P)-binding and DUF2867 domains [Microlunatus sagamiharensis]|uniref:Uncharacterized conserved protein YbjT, contains NAD(P)-binding and DUF2867 domains n=1 Tax=Microlunatus sagamiharensis TaxID=546874 RepID=A0A1H2LJR1_9ACTN|nr:NAD(P)H-binding protein [Microlunatus sagamiharensis]SDU81257.1 Uncharacterized conserved protein YbjT, contains NAD(P)-binding and DUF2867 domains [Microlunatus sagamiharensis]
MIVLSSATGHIGGRVLAQLLDHDAGVGPQVRVVVRDPAKLPAEVRERVEVVEGSHRDAAVVDQALAGADALFWLMPADPTAPSIYDTYVTASIPGAEAVVRHGVPRVVTVSALGRGTGLYAGHVSASLAMDDLFRSTGAHVRVLANPTFIDNLERQARSLAAGVLTGTQPADLEAPMVATRDIGDAAARLLLDDTWNGQDTVDLLGPEDLSADDVAAVLSEVLARPVRYERGDRAADVQTYQRYGMSPAVAQALVDMDLAKERGLDTAVTRTPKNTTPTTLRQWATEVLRPMIEEMA